MNKRNCLRSLFICAFILLIIFSVIQKRDVYKSHKDILLLNSNLSQAQRSRDKYSNFAYYSVIDYENSLKNILKQDFDNAALKSNSNEKVKFCIAISSYNNAKYVTQNINSVFRQKYHNWRLIFIDDSSNDGMKEIITKIKNDSRLTDNKFTFKINKQRTRSALLNYYNAAHEFCEDNEVLLMLDGDDMLAHSEVLTMLAEEYKNPNTWLTYGNQLVLVDGIAFDTNREIPANSWYKLRDIEFTTSHPHTVYVWLFNRIEEEDLKYNGNFLTSAWDLAFMFPLLEMAGPKRSKSIDSILYIYRSHQYNDGKLYSEEQKKFETYIRSKKPYKELN